MLWYSSFDHMEQTSDIWIEIHTFSFKKMHLEMSSGNRCPVCPGINELTACEFLQNSIAMNTREILISDIIRLATTQLMQMHHNAWLDSVTYGGLGIKQNTFFRNIYWYKSMYDETSTTNQRTIVCLCASGKSSTWCIGIPINLNRFNC